jgi:hypothetical protein
MSGYVIKGYYPYYDNQGAITMMGNAKNAYGEVDFEINI